MTTWDPSSASCLYWSQMKDISFCLKIFFCQKSKQFSFSSRTSTATWRWRLPIDDRRLERKRKSMQQSKTIIIVSGKLVLQKVWCFQSSLGFWVTFVTKAWMEIPLRGRVQTLATMNGDRLKVILPKSHYTRALTSRKPEERKPEELFCKCNLWSLQWSARSRVRYPWTTKFFGHSSLCFAIMLTMSCAYSVLVALLIICNVANSIDWVSIVPSPSENIIRKRVIFLKKKIEY